MKTPSYTLFAATLALFLFAHCVDEIKLDITGTKPKIVIDGLIADSLNTYSIRVHESSVIGVGNDNILTPISGAEVAVVDEIGQKYVFVEEEPGTYEKEMQAVADRLYSVEINLPDGKKIRSQPEKLSPAPTIGEINTEIKDETFINLSGNVDVDTRLILKMNTSLAGLAETPFLRWRASGEFEFKEGYPMALNTKTCYVKNDVDLNNLQVFDTRTLGGTDIVDEPFINTELDYRFAIQYCFHIQQYALSEREFRYWSAVNDIINIDGSLFDPPPGTVRGNLFNPDDEEEVIVGYFSVNGVYSTRFFANPQSLNQIHIDPKCRLRFGWTPTEDCLDCTTILHSSLNRPEYWEP